MNQLQDEPSGMLDELPDEVKEALALAKQERALKLAEKVDAFGEALAKKRQQAINDRKNSGIEDEWLGDEEAYEGIDDANRDTQYKPASPDGSFMTSRRNMSTRSTVYLNITRPYVDAAAARLADMVLPNDETNWDIRPTPIPDGVKAKIEKAKKQFAAGQQAAQQQAAGPTPPPQGIMPGAQTPVAQAASTAVKMSAIYPEWGGTDHAIYLDQEDPLQPIIDQANAAAKGAKRQIEDWLVQCQWHGEVRKAIEDKAKVGTGILKGPIPSVSRCMVSKMVDGQLQTEVHQEIVPATTRVNYWNFYPDGACGENVRNGSFVWEKDEITARQLRELKGLESDGYLPAQIDKVLEEGPQATKVDSHKQKRTVNDDEKFEIWYFWGLADREDLEAAGVKLPLEGSVAIPAVVTMVNDCVIKAALNPLDTGDFPYDVSVWQRRAGMPWGMGVARQINTPQRMLNASTRNMMDNAALTSGPQIVVRKGVINPADGRWEMTPRKLWYAAEGADVQDIQNAFIAINIPTQQEFLMNIIQFALKMAEDVTGLPMLMQGSQGTAPDTVGGMTIVNNNANVVLRRLVRTIDDEWTEPHIRRYYEYLMIHGEDDSIKGDYQIDARGSTSLIERDFQNNEAPQILQLSLNPAYDISPKKAMIEYLKSRRFDAKRFEPSDEERQEKANQPPPPMPQVEVAKIRVQGDLQKTQMIVQGKLQEAKMDTDRDTVYVQAEQEKGKLAHEAKMAELRMQWELAQLEYANKNQMKLEDVKSQLAQTAAKINLQRELAHMSNATKQVLKPPAEPAGRAPKGKAYAQ